MIEDTDHREDTESIETDGGVETANYLDAEINFFKPATPFMADHLKLIWLAFIGWVLFVFGPVTATAIAPDVMTTGIFLGFELHYFLTAVVAPLGALLLSAAYAHQRDRLDAKYGIEHGEEPERSDAVAADGGDTDE